MLTPPRRIKARLLIGVMALSAVSLPVMPGTQAQAESGVMGSPASIPMTTITAKQLKDMLGATTSTVMMQARSQNIAPEKIAALQSQLDGLMAQAVTLVQAGDANGGVQIPTQALQAMAANMQSATGSPAGTMSAQGLGGGMALQDLGLPAMPGFLGDGGLDVLIDYLITGLGQAISMIPVVGPPLAEIIKQVAGSLKSFLINNALAGGVTSALASAQEYYKVLQEMMGYADLNKLLGTGTKEVSSRLNSLLGSYGSKTSIGDPTTPQGIKAAVGQAQDSTVKGYKDLLGQFDNDPYKAVTGVSKYTTPGAAANEISAMINHYQAARLTNKSVRATGESLTAQAVGDEVVKRTADNVGTAMRQGAIARAGIASATTTLGAMTIQAGLMEQANNLNAMNAAAITSMLRQNLAGQDANLQVTGALLEEVIKSRKEMANAAQAQTKRIQTSAIAAANEAAASISSLQNISSLSSFDGGKHPMPGPYGERPFLR